MIFSVLHLFSIFAAIPIILKISEMIYREGILSRHDEIILDANISAAIFVILFTMWRFHKIDRRRVMLEAEILSVNSCAIIWNAVIVVHQRAMECIGATKENWSVDRYQNYTLALNRVTDDLIKNLPRIYDWVHENAFEKEKVAIIAELRKLNEEIP